MKLGGYRVLEVVVVLHMLRTHHSSNKHPVISSHELPVIWFVDTPQLL